MLHILTELSLIFALCLAGEGIAALLLVTNMGLFFIPSLVGTMEYVEVLRAQALPFLAVTFLTTPVVYLAAAWTVQLLMRRSRKEAERHV